MALQRIVVEPRVTADEQRIFTRAASSYLTPLRGTFEAKTKVTKVTTLWWTYKKLWKDPPFSWENPLFQWPCSIAMLVHQRETTKIETWDKFWCTPWPSWGFRHHPRDCPEERLQAHGRPIALGMVFFRAMSTAKVIPKSINILRSMGKLGNPLSSPAEFLPVFIIVLAPVCASLTAGTWEP